MKSASSEDAEGAARALESSIEYDDGLDRIQRFVKYIFAKHDVNEQLPPMPQDLAELAQDTMIGSFAGLLISGGKQWLDERASGPIQPPPNASTKAHAARAMAEEQTQRLLRISNAAVKGSFRFGSLAATFYSAQLLSGVYRGKYDFYNAAVGGMAAGTVLGISLVNQGVTSGRFRGAILGAALGASIGIPAGILQDKLTELLPEEQHQLRRKRIQQTEAIIQGQDLHERPKRASGYDPAGAVIKQLEASLASSPAQQSNNDTAVESDDDSFTKKKGRWKFW